MYHMSRACSYPQFAPIYMYPAGHEFHLLFFRSPYLGLQEMHLLLVMLLLFAASPAPSAADKFVVGDKKHWAPNVNYTSWPDQYHFHVGDWLEFDYEKGMYDVVQVDEAGYAACNSSNPIVSYSRGRSFVLQLNHTGRYYFICSRGYCFQGMKVTVLVEPPTPPPPPSVAPSSPSSLSHAPAGYYGVSWALVLASLGAAVLGLPFPV